MSSTQRVLNSVKVQEYLTCPDILQRVGKINLISFFSFGFVNPPKNAHALTNNACEAGLFSFLKLR